MSFFISWSTSLQLLSSASYYFLLWVSYCLLLPSRFASIPAVLMKRVYILWLAPFQLRLWLFYRVSGVRTFRLTLPACKEAHHPSFQKPVSTLLPVSCAGISFTLGMLVLAHFWIRCACCVDHLILSSEILLTWECKSWGCTLSGKKRIRAFSPPW